MFSRAAGGKKATDSIINAKRILQWTLVAVATRTKPGPKNNSIFSVKIRPSRPVKR